MPSQINNDDDTNVITRERPVTKEQIKKPSMYTLVILNDDFTPMDFVVKVLTHFCNISTEDATIIMLKIHKEGKGSCGRYTLEVAETKALQIVDTARKAGHPLLVNVEEIPE